MPFCLSLLHLSTHFIFEIICSSVWLVNTILFSVNLVATLCMIAVQIVIVTIKTNKDFTKHLNDKGMFLKKRVQNVFYPLSFLFESTAKC